MDKVKPFLLPGSILLAGLLIAGALMFGSDFNLFPEPAGRVVSISELKETVVIHQWDQSEGNQAGNPEATVTLVEYSDFACPFCTRHWSETLPLIKENFIDTGLVNFVFKDFPVVGGDRAAEASHCAGEQGAYWAYHDLLFSRHSQDRQRWGQVDIHMDYAEFLGLDAEELAECFESRRHQPTVLTAAEEAQQLGGTGTPFFVIGDETIGGAMPYGVFEEIFNSKLQAN